MTVDERKTKALAALMSAPDKTTAAQMAGIDQRTLRRYLNDPEFSEALQEACTELVSEAARRAQMAMVNAVGVLEEISKDKGQTASARISAAKAILSEGARLAETSRELEQRTEDARWSLARLRRN
jgi:ATP phosphoribosyltransferase regulatory subunit HisZ